MNASNNRLPADRRKIVKNTIKTDVSAKTVNKLKNNSHYTVKKHLFKMASLVHDNNNEMLSKTFHYLCKSLTKSYYRLHYNDLNGIRTALGLTVSKKEDQQDPDMNINLEPNDSKPVSSVEMTQ